MEDIKANLPTSEDDYKNGNGEGVFVLVAPEVKEAYDTDEEGGTYEGILDNDSIEYMDLNHGERVPLEMRGVNRPVVPYKWLIEHFEKA